MLSNENIICFSVTDYGHDIPVGKDHLMEIFVKNGNNVIMFNLVGTRSPKATQYDILKIFRKIKEWFSGWKIINGIYVINPFRFPFIRYEIFNKLNQLILYIYLKYYLKKFNISKPIFWVLNILYPDILKRMDKKALIYYISDDYALFSGNIKDVFDKYEKKMFCISDGLVTVSQKLYNKKSKYNKNTINILNATNPYHFIRTDKIDIPYDMKNKKKPIVGFSGKIEDWVDLELIKQCALKYLRYSFLLIGPVKEDIAIIKNVSNIYLLGEKLYDELPMYLNNFDICIIPFIKNKITETIDMPLKLVEYFAVGKPIIAININRIDKYADSYTLVENNEEFIEEVGLAIKKDSEKFRIKRQQIALENSWESRTEELSCWIENTILKRN